MARNPFAFAPFPDSTTGTDLVNTLVRLFGNLQQAIPKGPSNRALTVSTTLPNGIADEHTLIRCDATAGVMTVTLPSSGTSLDTVLPIKKSDVSANAVTIAAQGTDLIDGAATKSLAAQYKSFTLHCRKGGWDVLASV